MPTNTNYKSIYLSEKYDSKSGLTELKGIYNNNGNEEEFYELINEPPPNFFDLNERLENDFLSSPFDNFDNHQTFFTDEELLRVKSSKVKTSKVKSSKVKSSKIKSSKVKSSKVKSSKVKSSKVKKIK